MNRTQNDDTRYFVEIDLETLKIIRCGFDQKQYLVPYSGKAIIKNKKLNT
jgi:hypothetical protein